MSIVVDSSVLVAALLDTGSEGEWAEQILTRAPLHAPELVRVEVTNILRRLERAKEISTAEANAAYDDLMELNVETYGFEPFGERIWELRHTITSYDAWYVAVAEALRLPLATLDRKLSKSGGATCELVTPRKS